MSQVVSLFYELGQNCLSVLSYPIDPDQRIFYVYLLSSLLFAAAVYLWSPSFRDDRQSGRNLIRGFFSYLFPSKVWGHSSAWVDVRFFLPHQVVRLWIYTDLLLFFYGITQSSSWNFLQVISGIDSVSVVPANNALLVIGFGICSYLVIDFAAFFVHYLQHKIPALWEFHKVHHSSEVLHPLSNYREHPIDNISYAIATGISLGLITGLFQFSFGVKPMAMLLPFLGVNVISFAFNLFGYNLRHSHIWLRWPGVLGYLFGCPAHHQIHHSCKPHHINKNFAFSFPIWDVLFGTFYLPEEEEELEIGLGDGTEKEYSGIFTIYSLPFINLAKDPAILTQAKHQKSKASSETPSPG